MATRTKKIKYNNATITKDDDGNFIVVEVTKDDSIESNLTDELEDWVDIEGISITIQKDNKEQ